MISKPNNEAGRQRTSKFSRFAERVSRLDINPLHRPDFIGTINGVTSETIVVDVSGNEVHKHNLLDNNEEAILNRRLYDQLKSTYFEAALKYWSSLNLSRDFSNCADRLFPYSHSLPQLIHHLNEIIDILLETILAPKSLATEPVYHLLAILARDVRDEFAPYLPRVLQSLIQALNIQDIDSIDLTFYTLASLFRFLFRVILRDLVVYLRHYIPWLTHKKSIVRHFASESLSFLLRKESPEGLPLALSQIYSMVSIIDESDNQPTESNDNISDDDRTQYSESEDDLEAVDHRQIKKTKLKATKISERKSQVQYSSNKTQYLHEFAGAFLFDVVKNVDHTFTRKFPIVMTSFFSHLESFFPIESSLPNLFVDVTASVFFQCLRNHMATFDSNVCRDIELELLQFLQRHCEAISTTEFSSTQFLIPNVLMFNSSLQPLFCALRLIQEWVTLKPSPKGKPTFVIQQTFSVLQQLMKSISQTLKPIPEFNSYVIVPLWRVIIQTAIKFWTSEPSTFITEVIAQKSFNQTFLSLMFKNMQSILKSSQQFSYFDPSADVQTFSVNILYLIDAFLDINYRDYFNQFSDDLIQFMFDCSLFILDLSSDDQTSVKSAYELRCISLTLLSSLLKSENQTFRIIGFKSIKKSILEKQINYVNKIIEIKERQSKESLAVDSEFVDSELFNIIYFIKTCFLCDVDKNLRQLRITDVLTKLAHQLLSDISFNVNQFLVQLFNVLHLPKFTSSLLVLTEAFYLIFISSPDQINYSHPNYFFHNLDLLSQSSPLDSLFTDLLFLWHHILSIANPSSSRPSSILLSESSHWIRIYVKFLLDVSPHIQFSNLFNLSSSHGRSLSNLFLSCVLLTCRHPSQIIRWHSIKLLSKLPLNLLNSILNGRLNNCDFDSCLDCVVYDDSIGDQSTLWNVPNMLIENILELEAMEDSLDNEKAKIRLITGIPVMVLNSLSQFGVTWVTVLGLRILHSQLNQKFQLLWNPTVESITKIVEGLRSTRISRIENEESGDIHHSTTNKRFRDSDKEPKRKKRRRCGDSYLSCSVTKWVWSQLQGEVYLTCYNDDSIRSSRTSSQSAKYTKTNKPITGKYETVDDDAPMTDDRRFESTKYSQFWKVNSVSSLNNRTNNYRYVLRIPPIRQTDHMTRHEYLWKILSNLAKIHSPYIRTSIGEEDFTDDRIEWIMKYCLSSALNISENDGYIDSDDVVAMRKLIHSNKRDSKKRFIDSVEAVISLGLFADLGTSNNVLLSHWNKLVDICVHRLLLIPDTNLQSFCLRVALSSHLSSQLKHYQSHLEFIIDDVGLNEKLLSFSIDTTDGIVKSEHRFVVLPFFIKVLFSKLSKKTKADSNANMINRRKFVFRSLSGLPPDEIPYLLSIIFGPVVGVNSSISETLKSNLLLKFFQDLRSSDIPEYFNRWCVEFENGSFHSKWIMTDVFEFSLPIAKISISPIALCSLINSLNLLLAHMKQNIVEFIPFILQFFVSVIGEFYPILENQETFNQMFNQFIGKSRLRKVVKDSILLSSHLIIQNPELIDLWNKCLIPVQPVFIRLLITSLNGGSYSAIVKFICQMSQDPNLFLLFNGGLSDSVKLIINSLKSPSVLNSMFVSNKKGEKRGTGMVEAILSFILRLCRGGLESVTKAIKEVSTGDRRKLLKRRDDRSESDDDEEFNCQVNEIDERKKEIEADCELGRAVLQPYLGELLKNLEILLSYRKVETTETQQMGHTNNKRANTWIIMKCMEIFIELGQHMDKDVGTTCKLIELLTINLPKRKKSLNVSGMYKMMLTAIRELLKHFSGVFNTNKNDAENICQSAEKTLSILSSALTKQLQSVDDLINRHEISLLLLSISLYTVGIDDPKSLINDIIQSMADPMESCIIQWLPANLMIKFNSHSPTTSAWNSVSSNILLLALTSLRPRSASPEPNLDLVTTILVELLDKHLNPFNSDKPATTAERELILPVSCQSTVLSQCIYLIKEHGCDAGIRRMAIRVITAVIDRVGRAAELRQSIKLKSITENDIHQNTKYKKMENEWDECHSLLKILMYSVMTSIRQLIKHNNDSHHTRTALEILSQIVRVFSPVREYLPNPVTDRESFFLAPGSHETGQQLLINRFHLDLGHLIRFSGRNYDSLSGGVVGGDVFVELLHLQKHRRMRGIQILSSGLNQLNRSTALNICFPLGIQNLYQNQEQNEIRHIGLANSAIELLANSAKIVKWSNCLKLVIAIAGSINKNRNIESLLIKALIQILTAFDYQIDDAVDKFLKANRNQEERNFNIGAAITASVARQKRESKDKNLAVELHEYDEGMSENEIEESKEEIRQQQINSAHGQIESIQRSLRIQLLPMLKRLMIIHEKKDEHQLEKREQTTLVRPEIISLILQVSRYLPIEQFHSELPRLMHMLGKCLASRDLVSRRKARASFIAVIESLGPAYFHWCVTTVANSLSKGYQVSVLLFTTTAALCRLILGQTSVGKPNKCPIKITVGSIDESIPGLLPLVTQELDRLCDPDRPEYETGNNETGVLTKRAGVDEERYFRSGDLIHLLCRVATFETICVHIFKFLYGLLTGDSCEERKLGSNAFTKKYKNIVLQLFEQAVAGVAGNPSCDTIVKLRLSYRFLHLHHEMFSGSRTDASHRLSDDRNELDASGESFFLFCIKADKIEQVPSRTDDSFAATAAKLQEERMKKFIIQPGAATGRSAEQVMRVTRGVDRTARASILAQAGLKLLASILSEMKESPLFKHGLMKKHELSDDSYNRFLGDTCLYVIDCFCGSNDSLFQLAAKCLIQLLQTNHQVFHDNGRRIALTVLTVFQNSGASTSKITADQIRAVTSTCTRVLAILLSYPSSSEWFYGLMDDSIEINKAGKNRKTITSESRTLKTALLAQIRFSIEDSRLRLSALQLFRKLMSLKESNLQVAEHAELVYQCVDEIGIILLHQAGQTKLAGLCCSIYIDFLMSYPMTEKVQQKRVAFIVRNLGYNSSEGRRAMLSAIYELAGRLPPDVLRVRYAGLMLLSLILRLEKETDTQTRQMTRVVITRVFSLIDDEDSRVNIIKIIIKAFLSDSVNQRSALVEFIGIAITYYNESQLFSKLGLLLPPIHQSLMSSDLKPECLGSSSMEDWKLNYLSSKAMEGIVQHLNLVTIRKLTSNMESLGKYFMSLWCFTLTVGIKNSNPLVQQSAMNVLGLMLVKFTEVKKKDSRWSKCIEILFSREAIPELGLLKYKRKNEQERTYRMTPLSSILGILGHSAWDPTVEQHPSLCQSRIRLVVVICHVLMISKSLSDECEEIESEEIKEDQTMEIKEDQIIEIKEDQIIEIKEDQIIEIKEDQVMENNERMEIKNNVGMVEDKKTELVKNQGENETLSQLCYEMTSNEEDADVREEGNTEEEENVENIDEEEIEEDYNDSITPLEELKNSISETVADSHITTQDLNIDDYINLQDFHETNRIVTKTRMRWIINYYTWFIRRACGNIFTHSVRLCSAIRFLSQIVLIIPDVLLQSGRSENLLKPIIHAVCLCEGMNKSGLDSTPMESIEVAIVGKTPMEATGLIAQLGSESLSSIERNLKRRGLGEDFYKVLRDAQCILSKRRRDRKIKNQQLKVQHPNIAGVRKVKHNLKTKERKKKKMLQKSLRL